MSIVTQQRSVKEKRYYAAMSYKSRHGVTELTITSSNSTAEAVERLFDLAASDKIVPKKWYQFWLPGYELFTWTAFVPVEKKR